MLSVLLAMASLQVAAVDDFTTEGERLGRLSTLFGLCEPYYASRIETGHALAADFERRSTAAGWTAQERADAYTRGQQLERAEIGVRLEASGVTPQQARRYLREMLPRLKSRCHALAREVPGSISDVPAGDQRLDAVITRMR